MKAIARSLVVIFAALIAVPALAVTYTITTAVQLLAATALIMGGTQHPLSTPPDDPTGFIAPYMNQAVNNFIVPAGAGPVDNRVAVIYPAEFFPVFGSTTFDDSVEDGQENLNGCIRLTGCDFNGAVSSGYPAGPTTNDDFVVFGYSQSAVVASLVKRDLIANPPAAAQQDTKVVIIANPMRPTGGILGMGLQGLTIPIVGITFYGDTPTNSCVDSGPCYRTDDIAQEYDLLGGDAPVVLWNILAWVNSALAYAQLHGNVPNVSMNDPRVFHQGTYGDTDYYMIGARRLPVLMPLETAGVPGPLLAFFDAPLRVLIEWGHYHNINPGEPTGFQLLPSSDPITFVINLVGSIPVGIDDALQEAGIGRVLGTADVFRPFGVGGPVYNKTTGDEETEDANVLPFNDVGNSLDMQRSVLPGASEPPTAPEPPGSEPPGSEPPTAPEPPGSEPPTRRATHGA